MYTEIFQGVMDIISSVEAIGGFVSLISGGVAILYRRRINKTDARTKDIINLTHLENALSATAKLNENLPDSVIASIASEIGDHCSNFLANYHLNDKFSANVKQVQLLCGNKSLSDNLKQEVRSKLQPVVATFRDKTGRE